MAVWLEGRWQIVHVIWQCEIVRLLIVLPTVCKACVDVPEWSYV